MRSFQRDGTTAPRILIVDDSEDDVLLATAFIRRWLRGARFLRVDNAGALQEALETQGWDLVLCDHNMPGFDSQSALGIVRLSSATLPFFVHSGDFSRKQTADALRDGADGVVEKRDTSGLMRVIAEALGIEPLTHPQAASAA
jgi:CheY-like chemotaxis protein